MEIVQTKRETGSLLEVSGRLDAITFSEFEKFAVEVIDAGERVIVIDLSALEYISSAGLRGILASAKKMKKVGGTMLFCGLEGMVEEVFRVSGLASMFKLFANAEEAFNA